MRNNIPVINVYKKKSVKSEIVTQLLYGDTFKRLKKFGSWIKIKNDTDNYKGYIKSKNFPPNHKNTHKIHKLYAGADCSGLIQLFLNFNNRFCPRDAKDQIKYFKKKVELKNIKKNDLIFWKGHVALATSKKNLIHAYGPFKKVLVMPIQKTIGKIFKSASLKVIGIRRVV